MSLDRALLAALFVDSPFCVALYDLQGHVATANAAYERHWGIRLEDVPPEWSLLTDPQLAERGLLPLIERAYQGEHIILPPVEYDAGKAVQGVGRTVWTQGHCFPVRDDAGAITHLAILLSDVSSVMESERAMQQLAQTLEMRNEELRRRADEFENERERLNRIISQLPVPVAVLEGPELRVRAASSAYGSIIGNRKWRGERIRDLLPELRGNDGGQDFFAIMENVYATGIPSRDHNRIAFWDADADGIVEEHFVDINYSPLRDADGNITGITVVLLETTVRARALRALEESEARRTRLLDSEKAANAAAAEAADRARRLQQLTAKLNEAATREQIADVIFEGALASVHADAGSLAIVHLDADNRPKSFETIRTGGFEREVARRYRTYPVVPGRPLSDAILERRSIFLSTASEWHAQFPYVLEDITRMGFQAFAALPVIVADRPLAAISFSFTEPREFDDATRTFLETLAEQCALALERQRLHDAELHHSEQHAALLETIQDPFVAFDSELRFTYINTAAEQLLRQSSDALIGRRLDEVFPQGRGMPIESAIRDALLTRERAQLEAFSAMAGRWVEARIYPAPGGVSLVMEDVTQRRRDQAAAAFLAEASRLLSESLDYTSTLRTIAEAAVPQLGDWCAVHLVENPTLGEWPPRVDRVAVVHRDPAMLALGEQLTREYPTDWSSNEGMASVLRQGSIMFVPHITDAMAMAGARDDRHLELLRKLQFSSIIVVPLSARGLILGSLTLCTTQESKRVYDDMDLRLALDLAQRSAIAVDNARLYREAERARSEAEAANHAKSQFMATMSHELRTPLNAIQGHVQLLEMGVHGDVTPAQHDALARIERAERHLLGLIDDVLSYARLESGRVEYNVREVRVSELMVDILPLIEPQFAAKGVVLARQLEDEIPVLADQEKLGQVLLNLLTNALKFTASGGEVRVEFEPPPAHLSEQERFACIKVIDTGIGIAPDKHEAVFQPFVQVKGTYTSGSGGAGLGLAISRDLARGMGGDVVLSSTLGKGAEFCVKLKTPR